MPQETFKTWLQKSSPSISGFNAMTVTELLYKFEQYIQTHAIQGEKGDTGTSISSIEFYNSQVVGNQTINTYVIKYSNDTTENIEIKVENGEIGNGITSIDFSNSIVVGDQTVNSYIVYYTNGTTQTINIYAKNGTTNGEEVLTITPNLSTNEFNNMFWGDLSISSVRNVTKIRGYIGVTIRPVGDDTTYELAIPFNVDKNTEYYTSPLTYIPAYTPKNNSQGLYVATFQNYSGGVNANRFLFTIMDRYGNSLLHDNVTNINVSELKYYAEIS